MEWVIMIYEFTSLRVYERSLRAKLTSEASCVVLWVMLSSVGTLLLLFSVLIECWYTVFIECSHTVFIECVHTVAPVQCTHTNTLTLTHTLTP